VEYGNESFFAIDDHDNGVFGASVLDGTVLDGTVWDGAAMDGAVADSGPGLGGALGGTLGDPHGPPDHGADGRDGSHRSGHGTDRGPAGRLVPAGHMYVDYEGTEYDAGAIGMDRDHDGHADTAVIRGPRQVEYYTDRDGDGQADELTITTPDGHLISHETADAGHWHESPCPEPGGTRPDGGRIAVNYNGTRYDAGLATVDATGDGRPDTAVIRSPGQVEYYVDRDGDRRADELTITTPAGRLISHEEADPRTGRWHETPFHGRLPGRP
jgi:hypothetical protein